MAYRASIASALRVEVAAEKRFRFEEKGKIQSKKDEIEKEI